jgi:hypothetical protein
MAWKNNPRRRRASMRLGTGLKSTVGIGLTIPTKIKVLTRAELDALNQSAGIMHLPGAHKDRNNKYGDFQFRCNWITEKGQVESFLCACPLRERCN